jgi:hypothetical protein
MPTMKLSEVIIDEAEVARAEAGRAAAHLMRQTKRSRLVPEPVRRVFRRFRKQGSQQSLPASQRVVVAYFHYPGYPRHFLAMDYDGRETFWGYVLDTSTGNEGNCRFGISDLQWIKEVCGKNIKREAGQEKRLTPLIEMAETIRNRAKRE